MKLSILNGPNLNMLGHRDPDIYGPGTLEDIRVSCQQKCDTHGFEMDFYQSNHEGELIEKIHTSLDAAAMIINPGAYSHTSIALHDALELLTYPLIEVHISNIHAREAFRHHSFITKLATGLIVGLGIKGYRLAIDAVAELITEHKT